MDLQSLRAFFKTTAIYGVAAVLPRLINFALIAVYTSVLDTDQFHSQTTWYIYAAFINVVLTMGVETAFLRFYSSETDKSSVISSSAILLFVTSFIFLFLGTYFATQLGQVVDIKDSLAVRFLVWTTVLDTLVVIPFAFLRVTSRPLIYLALKVLNILSLFVATVIFLIIIPKGMKSAPEFWAKPQVIHIFLANFMASLISFLLIIPMLRKIQWHWNWTIVKKILVYSWPIMVGGIAFVINENLDKLIIPRWIDTNTNGIYSACYKLSVFMTLYVTAFRLGAEPYFFTQAKQADATQKYSQIMTWFVALGGLFMLFVVVFIDVFANIFLRQDIYKTGLFIVPILLLANLFSGIYNNLSIWYKLSDNTRIGMYISIFGAGLTAISLVILVPVFGMVGGAWATLFTYMTMALVSYLLGRKWYHVPYELRKISFFLILASILTGLHFMLSKGNLVLGVFYIFIYLSIVGFIQGVTLKKIKG